MTNSTGGHARILIMTADASAADEVTKGLKAMASNEKYSFSEDKMAITVISRMSEFEAANLRDFDIVVTDHTRGMGRFHFYSVYSLLFLHKSTLAKTTID